MEWRSENWLEKSGKIGPDDRKFAFLVKIQCGPIGQHCGEPGGYPTLWGPVHHDRPPTSLDLSDITYDYPVR
jgi:hypothetical protein